jgi:hypothetical protein
MMMIMTNRPTASMGFPQDDDDDDHRPLRWQWRTAAGDVKDTFLDEANRKIYFKGEADNDNNNIESNNEMLLTTVPVDVLVQSVLTTIATDLPGEQVPFLLAVQKLGDLIVKANEEGRGSSTFQESRREGCSGVSRRRRVGVQRPPSRSAASSTTAPRRISCRVENLSCCTRQRPIDMGYSLGRLRDRVESWIVS